jgi:hypothetical protein
MKSRSIPASLFWIESPGGSGIYKHPDGALNPNEYRFLPDLHIIRAYDEYCGDVYRGLFHRASRLRVVSLNLSHHVTPPRNANLCGGSLHRILAANRDEVLDRPTEHARFRRSFKDHVETAGHAEPDILCGLDLQAGGTWLGLNKTSGCVTFLYVDFVFQTREFAGSDRLVNPLLKNRTNITEPYGKYELSRGYLVSSLLLPSSSSGNPIKEEIQNLLDLESKIRRIQLARLRPSHLQSESESESEGSWKLSYEVTKLSNGGVGNPIVSRT